MVKEVANIPPASIQILFEGGTIRLRGPVPPDTPGIIADERTGDQRAEGMNYRSIIEFFLREKIPIQDNARAYTAKQWQLDNRREAFPHQKEALAAWVKGDRRGVIVLPTGTGKTFTAMLAIQNACRPAMIVTPTIDLMLQWQADLARTFQTEVGMLGGGEYSLLPLCVATYDSAALHVERWGNQYGLLIFDECHHLPGPRNSLAARLSIAPFRLGLTATPERSDGGEERYSQLIGPILYRREIQELSGEYLADYTTERIFVRMTEEEASTFQDCKSLYRDFLMARNISLGSPKAWQQFLFTASRSPQGREALAAYRRMKQIERSAQAKFDTLADLLHKHRQERTLIFTADNATVYQISRDFLVPALTHQTKAKERKEMLARFHSGVYSVIVTSQVLNEGVDVPAARIGIVLSGTSTIRENVQRLGRILRKLPDKQAILYEVILEGSSEVNSSDRRRRHNAFE